MKVVICGAGQVGTSIARHLAGENNDVTVIDQSPELIQKLVRATLKGMKDIMADPEGAAVDYVKAVPQHAGKEADMAAIFRMFSEYVYAGQDVVGEMDAERLAGLQKFYLDFCFKKYFFNQILYFITGPEPDWEMFNINISFRFKIKIAHRVVAYFLCFSFYIPVIRPFDGISSQKVEDY